MGRIESGPRLMSDRANAVPANRFNRLTGSLQCLPTPHKAHSFLTSTELCKIWPPTSVHISLKSLPIVDVHKTCWAETLFLHCFQFLYMHRSWQPLNTTINPLVDSIHHTYTACHLHWEVSFNESQPASLLINTRQFRKTKVFSLKSIKWDHQKFG